MDFDKEIHMNIKEYSLIHHRFSYDFTESIQIKFSQVLVEYKGKKYILKFSNLLYHPTVFRFWCLGMSLNCLECEALYKVNT